ncbi:hypothetical protein Hanom_Chr00s000003g01603641 [Helianthus anomalus]
MGFWFCMMQLIYRSDTSEILGLHIILEFVFRQDGLGCCVKGRRVEANAKRMLTALRERDNGEEGRDWRALLEVGVSQTRYGGGFSTAF